MKNESKETIQELIYKELVEEAKKSYTPIGYLYARVKAIETREDKNATILNKELDNLIRKNQTLEFQIQCGARTGHHFSTEHTNNCRTSFRCIKCELSYRKDNCDLNKKEKRLLAITLKEVK